MFGGVAKLVRKSKQLHLIDTKVAKKQHFGLFTPDDICSLVRKILPTFMKKINNP